MNFKAGDKVSFLNEKRSGTIIRIISNSEVLISDEYGFEVSASVNEIVPLSPQEHYTTDARMALKKEEEEKQTVLPPELSGDEVWEVDLHFHELFDRQEGISNHEKLRYQLNYFRKCMDAAMVHRIKRIIFIHGIGSGTLKQEIIYALKNYPDAHCHDAPFRKYGHGAIVVEIDYKIK